MTKRQPSNAAKNRAGLKRLLRSFGKYNLTLRYFSCKANPKTGQYEYEIGAARRGSGSNTRGWSFVNLEPEQRWTILELPRDPDLIVLGEGCRHGYRLTEGATPADMREAFGPGRFPKPAAKREPETCDACGERVGHYDPSLPEGEKIVITRDCECVRELNAREGRPGIKDLRRMWNKKGGA